VTSSVTVLEAELWVNKHKW